MATYAKNQLYMVPLAEVQPDPSQPRKYMDPLALDELTASVTQMGIIEPVVCRQDPATGLVYAVAGERRCAAARKAGLSAIPAIFVEGSNHAEAHPRNRQSKSEVKMKDCIGRVLMRSYR
jgi:ParB family transcriptional regulator, chromosome partitioning protein